MVECKVCNKKFKCITATHVKSHGMKNMAEYRSKFPDAKLKDESCVVKVNTLDFWVNKYGVELGEMKYAEYRQKMADSNTYEYKKEKYGWSREDFDNYNKSRAVTLDNMIKKHGLGRGTKKYNEYVETQRHAGTSEEYFRNKYGHKEGKRVYREVCNKKSHTLENYERLYGKDNAKEKLKKFQESNNTLFVSMVEKEFIEMLLSKIADNIDKVYFFGNKQFGKWNHVTENYTFYDLVLYNEKLCIEFDGDYWHCNPKKYHKDFYHPTLRCTAGEIWERDKIKRKVLEDDGFKVLSIWESDYVKDKDKIIGDCVNWIYQNMN